MLLRSRPLCGTYAGARAARLVSLVAIAVLLSASAVQAQLVGGGPGYEPLNPHVAARSPLGVIGWRLPTDGWAIGTEVEYGSAVERGLAWPAFFLYDAELMRMRLRARRDIGERYFVEVGGGVTGTYAGVFDPLFDRFHHMIGWVMQERDTRPHNVHADRMLIPRSGVDFERGSSPLALADMRVELGWHASAAVQPVVLVTVPTAPASSPFHRGTPTFGAGTAIRTSLASGILLEGSAAIAYAPSQGELAPVQRTRLEALSVGPRFRVWRGHELYGTFFYHSPAYRNTGFLELDRPETTADIGVDLRRDSGRRVRISVIEDLRRRDPGIDLILRVAIH